MTESQLKFYTACWLVLLLLPLIDNVSSPLRRKLGGQNLDTDTDLDICRHRAPSHVEGAYAQRQCSLNVFKIN